VNLVNIDGLEVKIKIKYQAGGRIYTGTPLKVLTDIKNSNSFTKELTVEEYIAFIVDNLRTFAGIFLHNPTPDQILCIWEDLGIIKSIPEDE